MLRPAPRQAPRNPSAPHPAPSLRPLAAHPRRGLARPRKPPCSAAAQPALTQVDEAHDHVGVVEEGAVLRAGHGHGHRLATTPLRSRGALRSLCQGVVEAQHEARSRRQPPRGRGRRLPGRRARAVRQPQDGEDLPLHLPLLVRLQPPVEEARGGCGRRLRRLPEAASLRGLRGAAGARQQQQHCPAAAAEPSQPPRHGAGPGGGRRAPRFPPLPWGSPQPSSLSLPPPAPRDTLTPRAGGGQPGQGGSALGPPSAAHRRSGEPGGCPPARLLGARLSSPCPSGKQGEDAEGDAEDEERTLPPLRAAAEGLPSRRLQPRSSQPAGTGAAGGRGRSAAPPPLAGAGGRSSGAGSRRGRR